MDTTKRFGQLYLVTWLSFSYLVATVVAAGFMHLVPASWPPARGLLAGILLGVAAGLLASLPLRHAVEVAAAALAQLARGQAIAPLPLDLAGRPAPPDRVYVLQTVCEDGGSIVRACSLQTQRFASGESLAILSVRP